MSGNDASDSKVGHSVPRSDSMPESQHGLGTRSSGMNASSSKVGQPAPRGDYSSKPTRRSRTRVRGVAREAGRVVPEPEQTAGPREWSRAGVASAHAGVSEGDQLVPGASRDSAKATASERGQSDSSAILQQLTESLFESDLSDSAGVTGPPGTKSAPGGTYSDVAVRGMRKARAKLTKSRRPLAESTAGTRPAMPSKTRRSRVGLVHSKD